MRRTVGGDQCLSILSRRKSSSESSHPHGIKEPFSFLSTNIYWSCAVLEITVGHRTLSNQILKMSCQFHIMIRHDDRTSHLHILSYLPCCQSTNYAQSNLWYVRPKERFEMTYVLWMKKNYFQHCICSYHHFSSTLFINTTHDPSTGICSNKRLRLKTWDLLSLYGGNFATYEFVWYQISAKFFCSTTLLSSADAACNSSTFAL